MKYFSGLIICFFLFCSTSFAFYSTPGTGVKWNLDNLAANAGFSFTNVSPGVYNLNDTVKIAIGDTIYINVNASVYFAPNSLLIDRGVLLINPPTGVLFSAQNTAASYFGMRVDTSSATNLRKLTFEYAVSLKISDCSPSLDSCIIQYNNNNSVTTFGGSAITLFRSNAIFTNSKFLNNQRAAIEGGLNINNAPKIIGCLFQGNNTTNQNKPQINLGATSNGSDTVKIINNQILRASTNSGGIAMFPSGNVYAVITGNTIKNNRYGMTFIGGSNIYAYIAYNIIDSNNTQNDPNLGGSGISFSGGSSSSTPQNSIVTGNLFRGNLWGITILGRSHPNIGNITNADTSDDGKNLFIGNTNTPRPGLDFFNNSIDTIFAQNNFWNTNNVDSVEMKIFHKPDSAVLGPVNYRPIKTIYTSGNPNYGSNNQTPGNLYYYANSTPGGNGYPSQPAYSWRDTTGSTSLIVNKVNTAALGAGNTDNGRFDITGALAGDQIRFFGNNFSDFFIGTNGIISFTAFDPTLVSTIEPPIEGLPQAQILNAAFPLWTDIDFSNALAPAVNRLSYKVTSTELIITYDNAYVNLGTTQNYVSFQVIFSHTLSPSQNSQVTFQYNDAATGVEFISRYNNLTQRRYLTGLQGANSGNSNLTYRQEIPGVLVANGPLFSSPLAVTFGPSAAVLPVELVSFTSETNANNVSLSWSTAREHNNRGFEIQRAYTKGPSWNGMDWKSEAFIEGKGNTESQSSYSYTDKKLASGKYKYRLKQTDLNGNYEYFMLANEVVIGTPDKFSLSQNYPNPFNPATKIDFQLPQDSRVTLKIYDLTGREIAFLLNNELRTAGYYTSEFSGTQLASGTYFYKLTTDKNNTAVKKMILLK